MAAIAKRKPYAHPGNRSGTATKGRPKGPTLTKKLGLEICERIGKGIPVNAAAQASGVAKNTVHEWVRRGCGEDDRPRTPMTEWFAGAFSKAIAECHAGLVVELREGAKTDSRLLMFMLERRFPEDWSRPEQRLELTGAGGGPITIKLAFDDSPIPARPMRELGGPVIDVEAVEET